MNVCRSLLLIALCLIAEAALCGQVLPSAVVLSGSQAATNSITSSAENDVLPESPLPVQSSFADFRAYDPGSLAGGDASHERQATLRAPETNVLLCNCGRDAGNSGHALRITFTTYDRDGRPTPDVPEVAGAYRSRLASTSWDPHRLYNPLVQGIRFGQQEVGEIFTGNLFGGVTSNIKHALHLGSSEPAR